jgi:hypothetical protein
MLAWTNAPAPFPVGDDDKEHCVVIVMSTPGSPEPGRLITVEETPVWG